MSDKGGLQLLPETRKKIDVRIPGENKLIYVGAIIVALVLLAYAGLYFYSRNLSKEVSSINEQIKTLEEGRNKAAEAKLLTLSKQINIVSQVLANHKYWSIGLSKIEAATQNNVQFKSFTANMGASSFQFRAFANDYSSVARQIAAYVADDSIRDISLDNVNIQTNGQLDFNSKITFDPTKFLIKRK